MGTVEEFGKWATGNIADALRAMGYTVVMDHEIHPIFTQIKLVGRAMTMRAERTKRKSDQADVSTIAKENCRKGDVVILDCKGYENGDSALGRKLDDCMSDEGRSWGNNRWRLQGLCKAERFADTGLCASAFSRRNAPTLCD